jgi:hypothetical protein
MKASLGFHLWKFLKDAILDIGKSSCSKIGHVVACVEKIFLSCCRSISS